MGREVNYTKEAFLHTGNLVFAALLVATATAVALLPLGASWLSMGLLVIGTGMELLYLGLRSSSPQFRRQVRVRKRAESRAGPDRAAIYRELSRRGQRRYYRLRQFREEIRSNYRQLSYASQEVLDTHLEKIDGLLRSYLDLLYQRERCFSLAHQSTEEEVRQSKQALEDDLEGDADRVQSVKQRRLDVLEKRLDRFQNARENLAVIGAQLGTIEDTVKYIREQSWTLQNPDEVTMELDVLLEKVEETQRSVHEIEAVFSRSGAHDDDLEALDEELSAALEADRDRSTGESAPGMQQPPV